MSTCAATPRLSDMPRSCVAPSVERAAFCMRIGNLPFAAPHVTEVVEVVDGPGTVDGPKPSGAR